MDKFKNINKKVYIKKVLFSTVGTILCMLGISFLYVAKLGTDPITVFIDGISMHVSLSIGTINTICNIVLVVLMLIFERKLFDLETLIQALISGFFLDLFIVLFEKPFSVFNGELYASLIMMFVGIAIYAFGIAITIACDVGIGPFNFPPLYFARILKAKLKYVQTVTDALYFLVGTLLGGLIGIGTLLCSILFGPFLSYFIDKLQPMVDGWGNTYKE